VGLAGAGCRAGMAFRACCCLVSGTGHHRHLRAGAIYRKHSAGFRGNREASRRQRHLRRWVRLLGVRVSSAENLQRRGDAEIAFLMQVIEDVVASRLARPQATWQVHTAGPLDVLPGSTARALKEANRQKAAARSPDSPRSSPPMTSPGTCTQPGSPIPPEWIRGYLWKDCA
jgi:Putative undecaprenyl diphosphate synthase